MRITEELESQVLSLPPLRNILLDFVPEKTHLELDGYEPHIGLRPRSKHWRKPSGNGCFHITLHKKGRCRIHWDAWDPRRFPLKHLIEVAYRYFRFPILYLNQD